MPATFATEYGEHQVYLQPGHLAEPHATVFTHDETNQKFNTDLDLSPTTGVNRDYGSKPMYPTNNYRNEIEARPFDFRGASSISFSPIQNQTSPTRNKGITSYPTGPGPESSFQDFRNARTGVTTGYNMLRSSYSPSRANGGQDHFVNSYN